MSITIVRYWQHKTQRFYNLRGTTSTLYCSLAQFKVSIMNVKKIRFKVTCIYVFPIIDQY